MGRRAFTIPTILALCLVAVASLAWGIRLGFLKSDDLLRRSEEISLFVERHDPYSDPDSTYPPSAFPLLAPLIAPFDGVFLRLVWIGINLASAVWLAYGIDRLWGRSWPLWLGMVLGLVVLASKPIRLSIGMGQFSILPTALLVGALWLLNLRRPILAGLLVGIALTKPTMALPFLAFLLVHRPPTRNLVGPAVPAVFDEATPDTRHGLASETLQSRVPTVSNDVTPNTAGTAGPTGRTHAEVLTLLVALALQGLSVLFASAWLGRSPLFLIREWLNLARLQQSAGLVDVPSLLAQLSPRLGERAGSLASMLILAAAFAFLVTYRRRPTHQLGAFALLIAALFTYHRPYDLVLLLPSLAVAIDAARRSPRHWPAFAVGAACVILLLPNHPSIVGRLARAYDLAFVVVAYGLLAVSVREIVRGGTKKVGDPIDSPSDDRIEQLAAR